MPFEDSGAPKVNLDVVLSGRLTTGCMKKPTTPLSTMRQKRLLETNPNSFRKLVSTFLEANGRGYWETSEENLEKLKQLYQDVEDKIEGIDR
jgi:hypothetical protein